MHISPELWVIAFNGDCLRNVEWILEHKFEELSCSECGVQSVFGSDGLREHVGDLLCFTAFTIGLDHTQITGMLHPIGPMPLKQFSKKFTL